MGVSRSNRVNVSKPEMAIQDTLMRIEITSESAETRFMSPVLMLSTPPELLSALLNEEPRGHRGPTILTRTQP